MELKWLRSSPNTGHRNWILCFAEGDNCAFVMDVDWCILLANRYRFVLLCVVRTGSGELPILCLVKCFFNKKSGNKYSCCLGLCAVKKIYRLMSIQKPFALCLSALVNLELFQTLLSTIRRLKQLDGSWKYCVQFVKSFQLWRKAEEGEKRLRVPGFRPRRLAIGCLSKLSDSAVDGGIICSWSKDELQQIGWNMRDFLSSWLMGRAKRQNNPLTSAIWTKSSMEEIPCLLGHTIPPLPLLIRLFWEWAWCFFFVFFFYDYLPFDQYCMIYIISYINLHVGMRKVTHSIRIWKSGRKPVMRTCIVNIVCSLWQWKGISGLQEC